MKRKIRSSPHKSLRRLHKSLRGLAQRVTIIPEFEIISNPSIDMEELIEEIKRRRFVTINPPRKQIQVEEDKKIFEELERVYST